MNGNHRQSASLRLIYDTIPCQMPELDGYEIGKKLKEDPVCREIPVIFITGTNDKESEYAATEDWLL